jgi:hypothetical protein
MYKVIITQHPGAIRTRDLLLSWRRRWQLHHAAIQGKSCHSFLVKKHLGQFFRTFVKFLSISAEFTAGSDQEFDQDILLQVLIKRLVSTKFRIRSRVWSASSVPRPSPRRTCWPLTWKVTGSEPVQTYIHRNAFYFLFKILIELSVIQFAHFSHIHMKVCRYVHTHIHMKLCTCIWRYVGTYAHTYKGM